MPQCAKINRTVNIPEVLNMPKFWIWQSFEYGRVPNMWGLNWIYQSMSWQSSEYIFGSAYTRILDMAGFWICKSTKSSKYVTIWLNMLQCVVNMPEYIWIYNNRQGYEQVTLQVNEYLLRNMHIQNPVKDLRWSTLEKFKLFLQKIVSNLL